MPIPSQGQAVPASPPGMGQPRDGGMAGHWFCSFQPPPSQILSLPSPFAVAEGWQRRWEAMKRYKALSILCVYLSTRISWSLQKPGRKLLNDKTSILSPSSQAKNKIKPLCQAHFCCNHAHLSAVDGGEDGPLPCCFSAVQLPVTARAGKRKPVVGEAAQHCSLGLLTASSSPKSTSPSPAQRQQGVCKAAFSWRELGQDPAQTHSCKVQDLCLGRGWMHLKDSLAYPNFFLQPCSSQSSTKLAANFGFVCL